MVFAQLLISWTEDQWMAVAFSDEMRWELASRGPLHGLGIISAFGVGPLILADQRLDGRRYSALVTGESVELINDALSLLVEVLLARTGLVDDGRVHSVQDNAPCHRARVTKERMAGSPW